MVNDIINKLKEGSIKSVALFGDGMKAPAPPCVTVKPEAGTRSGTRSFKITVRHKIGGYDELEEYALVELDALLGDPIDGKEGRFRLYPNGYSDVSEDPEWECVYMERTYFAPVPGLAR